MPHRPKKSEKKTYLQPGFPATQGRSADKVVVSPSEMEPMLLTKWDFFRLDLTRLPEMVRLAVEHDGGITIFTGFGRIIRADADANENKGHRRLEFDSHLDTEEMIARVEKACRDLRSETGEGWMGRDASAASGVPFQRIRRQHSPQGNLELEVEDLLRLNLSTLPENEWILVVVNGKYEFEVKRAGQSLIVGDASMWAGDVNGQFRGSFVKIGGEDSFEIQVERFDELPEDLRSACVIKVEWHRTFPITANAADLIQAAAERRKQVDAAVGEITATTVTTEGNNSSENPN